LACVEPPAQGKRTAHKRPMSTNGPVAPHHEVCPAEFVLHLFVALLHSLRSPYSCTTSPSGVYSRGKFVVRLPKWTKLVAIGGEAHSKYWHVRLIAEQREIGGTTSARVWRLGSCTVQLRAWLAPYKTEGSLGNAKPSFCLALPCPSLSGENHSLAWTARLFIAPYWLPIQRQSYNRLAYTRPRGTWRMRFLPEWSETTTAPSDGRTWQSMLLYNFLRSQQRSSTLLGSSPRTH
jgi:hypothetical protein